VLASNLVEDMDETDDGETATCTIKRVGRATPIVRSFSNADAAKAGLKGKAGPWTQYPARMRQMRARAFALRDGFPDVLKGLRVAEETHDYADFSDATPRPAQGVSVPLSGAMLLEQATETGSPAAANSPADGTVTPPSTDAGQSSGAASTEAEYAEAAEAAPAGRPPSLKAWRDGFIASVNVAPDRAFLADLQTNNMEPLAKLKADHPTHYDMVQDAIAARLADLDANDLTDGGDEA
jgi:hypothetical protein